jgi:hypothetical protein
MSLNFSRREIGLLYGLLQSANDHLLERLPFPSGEGTDGPLPVAKSVRLNKLIASNLRQKLRSELDSQ